MFRLKQQDDKDIRLLIIFLLIRLLYAKGSRETDAQKDEDIYRKREAFTMKLAGDSVSLRTRD